MLASLEQVASGKVNLVQAVQVLAAEVLRLDALVAALVVETDSLIVDGADVVRVDLPTVDGAGVGEVVEPEPVELPDGLEPRPVDSRLPGVVGGRRRQKGAE